MNVKQILNNNAVIGQKGKEEVIIVNTGIGFHKKVGDVILENEIGKTFILSSHKLVEDFSRMMQTTSKTKLQIVDEVMEFATQILQTRMYDFVYIAFLEHINFAIERVRKQIYIKSPLSYDVKRFYQKEFKIGQYAVALMNAAYHLNMDDEEAVQIALHFVNNQSSKSGTMLAVKMTEIVADILRIIKLTAHIEVDETQADMQRLILHLQYFAKRILQSNVLEGRDGINHEQSTLCAPHKKSIDAIEIYLANVHQYVMNDDERLYLAIHFSRCLNK